MQVPQNQSSSHVPQTKNDQKLQKRKFLLKKLLRNQQQLAADNQLQKLLNQDKQLLGGFQHNKFGTFCLQAGQLDKAEEHLNKAKQIINEKKNLLFSNVEMNLGNLYAQQKEYKKAIQHYEKVIQLSPHNNPEKYNNNNKQEEDKSQKVQNSLIFFSSKLNSFNAFVDAYTNLAVMYVQINQFQKGFQFCKKSLQLKPQQSQAIINFTDIMRQLGKKQQAIAYTWNQIVKYTKKKGNIGYEGFKAIEINSWNKPQKQQTKYSQKTENRKINILCVKWGTRYSADYVNKLFSSIKRNTSWQIQFYCFTDDPSDLNSNIKIKKLQQGWKKWWGKVTLFNKQTQINGKKFYIDLDMVITGNLDQLFQYQGQFAILRSGDLVCQKNHKQGYNSSVMIWESDFLQPVYDTLKNNFQIINKFIVRFDFWLEMTINNADYIQKIYPGKVIDFLGDAKQKLPEKSSVVCFARKPKPEDYPAEWIKQHWIE